jgi:hypothetical protein
MRGQSSLVRCGHQIEVQGLAGPQVGGPGEGEERSDRGVWIGLRRTLRNADGGGAWYVWTSTQKASFFQHAQGHTYAGVVLL